jgi:peroxiredoxin
MAQLRQDYTKFEERNTTILVIGPEDASAFRKFFVAKSLPFIGLPDPTHSVLNKYGQETNLFKLGRMPAQVLVDRNGMIHFVHYGHDMTDIPQDSDILAMLDELNGR